MPRTPATQLTAARKHLNDARLLAFFHGAAKLSWVPSAINIINRGLAKGETLDEIFGQFKPVRGSEGSLVINLSVKRSDDEDYLVTFGFHGALVGDGGEWRVSYSDADTVVAMEQLSFWIS